MTPNRFLFLLLIVAIAPSSLFSNTIYFPQAVFGGGYSTTFVIMNTGTTPVSARFNFFDQSGTSRAALNTTMNVFPGGSARVSLPNTGPLTVIWGELAAGSGTVQGFANYDLRTDNGTLITTAGVPGIDAGNSFVLPVDVTPNTSTGVAIAYVKDGSPFNIGLRLLREDGSQIASANDVRFTALGSRRQVADLVTSIFPQLSGTTFKGTLVVEAAAGAPADSLAASALTLREGTLAALPVIPAGSTGSNTLYFPQIAFGGGYSTTLVIMNTGVTAVASRINFYDQSGSSRVEYNTAINLPAGGSTRHTLANTGPLTVLWGELAAAPGTVKGVATIERRADNGVLLTTAGLFGVEAGNSFRFPLDATPTGSTAFAIANVTNDSPVNVAVRLITPQGSPLTSAPDVRLNPLGPRQQIADFATKIFPGLGAVAFNGTLVLEAAAGSPANSLAAIALNVKERGTIEASSALTALPRDLTSGERKAIDAANAFSLSLWAKTNAAQRGSNVFVSPLSATFALGMTLNGAANQTLEEMRSALQLGSATQQEINEGYRSLMTLLTGVDPAVKMQIANSIWYRNGFPFLSSFLDSAKQYFDAEVTGLNFADEAGSLKTINGWVDSKTNHKIPTILDEITPDAVMFLINAIYFNGPWRDKFDPAQTRTALFRLAEGTTQPVSLMHRFASMSYVDSPAYQAVDLPYGNSAFTMTVVLPRESTDVESVAASLTPDTWQSLTNGLRNVAVDLSLPKLKLSYERKLNADLQALGMISAFVQGAADFTRMSPSGRQLYIDFVKQKTFVDISEEGTEAAAVTAVGVNVASAPPPPMIMRVDRPYIFMIRERLSGTLLFMGKITQMP
jgi:serpin B